MWWSIITLFLISFGAMLALGIFHLTFYFQQKDKAFRNYACYLFLMALFNVVRLLDERIPFGYNLSFYWVDTLDPILSNLAFLMYVNFLGVILNIKREEVFYYRYWKTLQVFILLSLCIYLAIRFTGGRIELSTTFINIASICIMGTGFIMILRLFSHRKETFFQMIITGTLINVIAVLSGFLINIFIYNDNRAFEGLYYMEAGILLEAIILSAALGYRMKMAYLEKALVQQDLLEETKKNESLALETARLLRRELDIKEMREKIGKDLHDDVGATISSMSIYSELATKVWHSRPDESREMLEKISRSSRELLSRMSDIIWSMKINPGENGTIEARIKKYVNELLVPKEIVCEYDICTDLTDSVVEPDIRKNILLIIKECLNNIAKYSEATQAEIIFKPKGKAVILSISDNGNGVELSETSKGNGLYNIKHRCECLGGKLIIKSSTGFGFSVNCTFPIATFSYITQPGPDITL